MIIHDSRSAGPATRLHIPPGDARLLMVEHLGELLAQADSALTRERVTLDAFTRAEPYRLPTSESLTESLFRVENSLHAFGQRFDGLEIWEAAIRDTLSAIARPEIPLHEIALLYLVAIAGYRAPPETAQGESSVLIRFSEEGLDVFAPASGQSRQSADEDFLAEISQLIANHRDVEDDPTTDELIAIQAAYWLLDRGVHIPGAYPIWGTSGFRDVQTYASITDPGEGHLAGTTRDVRYLRGVIVHVEHLERGGGFTREEMEPYRVPSARTVARVRLHVGRGAPTSSYLGRPLFEGTIANSQIKTGRTFAAAASALLADNLAEVKLAVEGLSADEAITLLATLSRETRRDPHTQVLSAAFNINSPILDDRQETIRQFGRAVWRTTPEEIGLLGIAITRGGGFGKVTWDGTSNTYPSSCVITQLTMPVALTLVHRAHEVGLLTYFSAGFRLAEVPLAVYTGVDGIGLGGAQILRYMDVESGYHGPFIHDNIGEILAVRDGAEATDRGRAAALLARLDRLYFEGSLLSSDDDIRRLLFEALLSENIAMAAEVRERLPHVLRMTEDTIHPLLAWADRLGTPGKKIAQDRIGGADWDAYLRRVRHARRRSDLQDLAGELGRGSAAQG